MRDRVEQDELDFDTQQGLWKPSLFDLAEDVCEELEEERFKRPDGTYTDGPSLKQFAEGMTFEEFKKRNEDK